MAKNQFLNFENGQNSLQCKFIENDRMMLKNGARREIRGVYWNRGGKR